MNVRNVEVGLGFLLLMAFDTAAQVSFKLAGMHAPPPRADLRWLLSLLAHPWIYGAIAAYIGAFLTWIKLLRRAPIGPAFAASHMEVVSVMLVSALAFGEHVGLVQGLGATLIVGGIVVLAMGAAPAHSAPGRAATPAKGMRKIPRLGCWSEPELSPRRTEEQDMSQSIAEQVYDIVATHGSIDRATLTPDSTLKDLGIDSLEAIETIFDVEEHFDINFPNRDPNLDDGTLSGLIQSVEQALASKTAAATTAN